MRKCAVAFLALLLLAAGNASAATVFQDNVEAGTGSWMATGLWHREVGGAPCLEANSGTASWYYGTASCNFDVGTNSGSLTSPPIAIPSGQGLVQLSFWEWYQTEGGTFYDRRTVQISVDGGSFTTLQQLPDDGMGFWRQRTLDLSLYPGRTVQVRFLFETIDSVLNNFRGWYVDDVLIYATTTPYALEPVPFDYLDIASPVNLLGSVSNCDDCGQVVPLGFNFFYFGSQKTHVGVSSNGYVAFNTASLTPWSNVDIPNPNLPNDMIAPFWDDLYTSGTAASNVYAATVGTAPNRKFVVQYENVDYCCSVGSGRLNFQTILSEEDQSITFQYLDMLSVNSGRGGGDSATIGIENASGTDGLRYAFNQVSVTDGMALRFVRTNPDTDGDGLPDIFELTYGTDPFDPNDPVLTDDVDGDGLDWLEEYFYGTNPLNPDTDGDGVSDGDEIAIGTNPLVSDAPVTLVTFAGPGTAFGTAYFEFDVSNFDPQTTGYHVFYGAESGNAIADYYNTPLQLGLGSRSGLIDQSWGFQGVPVVYLRVAPVKTVAGRTFVGNLSNEVSTYFAGSVPSKTGAPAQPGDGSGVLDDSDDSDDLWGFCFVRTLGGTQAGLAGLLGAFGVLGGAACAWRRSKRKP